MNGLSRLRVSDLRIGTPLKGATWFRAQHAFRIFVSLIFLFVLFHEPRFLYGDGWLEIKDKHFVVFYNLSQDESLARSVLRKAEDYYDKIAYRVGYQRYSDFWTWDDRVKIMIFSDQKTYQKKTGQPAWSLGYSTRDSYLFKSRSIVTYRQQGEFVDGLLPHEISHLVLKDLIGFDRKIPVWFDEGVAQLQEAKKKEDAYVLMKNLVSQGQYVKFDALMKGDIRGETDARKIMIFYAQSLVMVDFLIKEYGNDAFIYLCRELRQGKTMEDAFKTAYSSIGSIGEFEKKWLREFGQ